MSMLMCCGMEGLVQPAKCKTVCLSLEASGGSFSPFPLNGVDGRSPREAEMRAGQAAFCSVWFSLSVTHIVARNSCFSEVQTCHLFSVETGRMSEVMFKF